MAKSRKLSKLIKGNTYTLKPVIPPQQFYRAFLVDGRGCPIHYDRPYVDLQPGTRVVYVKGSLNDGVGVGLFTLPENPEQLLSLGRWDVM